MGMEQRVAGTARAVIERRRDNPIARQEAAVAFPGAGEHRSVLVVADDLIDRLRVSVANRRPTRFIRQRP